MKKTWIGGLAVALLAATGASAATVDYEIDTVHSHVGFAVKHLGVSTVRGEFKEYGADLRVDEDNLAGSSITLRIQTASIDTDNQRRDDHLRSDDFLNAEAYPELVFESTGIEATGDGEYLLSGKLTIRDTTRELQIPVTAAGPIDFMGGKRLGVEGEITIDRQEFGVKFNRVIESGGLVVSNDVKISFSIEAKREAATEETAEGR